MLLIATKLYYGRGKFTGFDLSKRIRARSDLEANVLDDITSKEEMITVAKIEPESTTTTEASKCEIVKLDTLAPKADVYAGSEQPSRDVKLEKKKESWMKKLKKKIVKPALAEDGHETIMKSATTESESPETAGSQDTAANQHSKSQITKIDISTAKEEPSEILEPEVMTKSDKREAKKKRKQLKKEAKEMKKIKENASAERLQEMSTAEDQKPIEEGHIDAATIASTKVQLVTHGSTAAPEAEKSQTETQEKPIKKVGKRKAKKLLKKEAKMKKTKEKISAKPIAVQSPEPESLDEEEKCALSTKAKPTTQELAQHSKSQVTKLDISTAKDEASGSSKIENSFEPEVMTKSDKREEKKKKKQLKKEVKKMKKIKESASARRLQEMSTAEKPTEDVHVYEIFENNEVATIATTKAKLEQTVAPEDDESKIIKTETPEQPMKTTTADGESSRSNKKANKKEAKKRKKQLKKEKKKRKSMENAAAAAATPGSPEDYPADEVYEMIDDEIFENNGVATIATTKAKLEQTVAPEDDESKIIKTETPEQPMKTTTADGESSRSNKKANKKEAKKRKKQLKKEKKKRKSMENAAAAAATPGSPEDYPADEVYEMIDDELPLEEQIYDTADIVPGNDIVGTGNQEPPTTTSKVQASSESCLVPAADDKKKPSKKDAKKKKKQAKKEAKIKKLGKKTAAKTSILEEYQPAEGQTYEVLDDEMTLATAKEEEDNKAHQYDTADNNMIISVDVEPKEEKSELQELAKTAGLEHKNYSKKDVKANKKPDKDKPNTEVPKTTAPTAARTQETSIPTNKVSQAEGDVTNLMRAKRQSRELPQEPSQVESSSKDVTQAKRQSRELPQEPSQASKDVTQAKRQSRELPQEPFQAERSGKDVTNLIQAKRQSRELPQEPFQAERSSKDLIQAKRQSRELPQEPSQAKRSDKEVTHFPQVIEEEADNSTDKLETPLQRPSDDAPPRRESIASALQAGLKKIWPHKKSNPQMATKKEETEDVDGYIHVQEPFNKSTVQTNNCDPMTDKAQPAQNGVMSMDDIKKKHDIAVIVNPSTASMQDDSDGYVIQDPLNKASHNTSGTSETAAGEQEILMKRNEGYGLMVFEGPEDERISLQRNLGYEPMNFDGDKLPDEIPLQKNDGYGALAFEHQEDNIVMKTNTVYDISKNSADVEEKKAQDFDEYDYVINNN